MPRPPAVIAALVICLLPLAGCSDAPTASAGADHDGLALDMTVRATGESLKADVTVRNTRGTAVHLDADQCGRVTEVVLARTVFQPEGATYTGSLDAVKKLVLQQQRSNQSSDRFAPRRATGGSDTPDCVRPTVPVTIGPGASIAEHWELPFGTAYGLAVVGSAHESIRAQVVESVAADKLGFLDILPEAEAQAARAGRVATAETPASAVLDRPPTSPDTEPSLGQRFDRMIDTGPIRTFIETQPPDTWRRATITPTLPGPWEFRAVTTGFERALRVDLAADGSVIGTVDIPGPGDRSHVYERRPATLPPGVTVIPEPDTPTLTEDVVAGRLSLPTGRVVADGSLIGRVEPLADQAQPGAYPVFVTVGRLAGSPGDTVAFASLVVSDAQTVRWVARSTIGVDGGTAGFTSAEGSTFLRDSGATANEDTVFGAFDALTAHDDLIARVPIGDGLDMALFTTGFGDGGYTVYVGLDRDGKPTRYVIDFAVVHLAWPP